MVNTKLKLLYILLTLFVFKPLLADEKLTYDYEGPTNWGKKKHKGNYTNKCYFKFGIYSNANQKAKHKHLAEGMTVFTDYMAMAKTEEKLEALLLKDK